jgi:Rps23 Pro-64 3,4-dihydroxylase Tpa1-like proline 4-hydroxylase
MNYMDRKELADLILAKLEKNKETLKKEFSISGRVNSCYIDDLLPDDICRKINSCFPDPNTMSEHRSLRENKKIAAQLNKYHPLLEEITYAFQDPRILKLTEEFTGLKKLEPDEFLYAGGISLMSKGNFLNPHLDNSHDKDRKRYRVINLLYYVTPDWQIEYGGNLELWDAGMGPDKKPRTIQAKFNRLVFMITNTTSYHSVSKVIHDGNRCCISNYYFSEIPAESSNYFHVTSFYGRPEELLKRIMLPVDNFIRNSIRTIFPKGIRKTKHIYKK